RQKARDLKASLADEMSAATATLLSTSDRLTDTQRWRSRTFLAARDSWRLASLRIEARLRTYFQGRLVSHWQEYAREGSVILEIAMRVGYNGAAAPGPGLPSYVPRPLGTDQEAQMRSLVAEIPRSGCGRQPNDAWRRQLLAETPVLRVSAVMDELEPSFLRCGSILTNELLAAAPRGYSTSAHDLIHDLIP